MLKNILIIINSPLEQFEITSLLALMLLFIDFIFSLTLLI